ncbi:MAG TPA: PHB depolymerase family esterase [Steroidobacteraceae bacterium]|nr:PHB depolymerase family esterase [Steroidobacteraceae bacterium]
MALAAEPDADAPGLHGDVAFSVYSPLASSAELMRRLLSPLAAWQVEESVAHGGDALRAQEVNLAEEHFALYVPAHAASQGHGLLVFVAPWQEAALPRGWDSVLERYDIVYVSAANSGNDANVLGRREPLAVLAATNVMRRLKIDPQRVYVGGFSGGSRVALRLALGYPDVFHGALLNAGSDAIGTATEPLPPAELLHAFQETMHVVYITGEQDKLHRDTDAVSIASLRHWCVNAFDEDVTTGAGHDVADPRALSRALETLRRTKPLDTARLAACRSNTEAELAKSLERLGAFVDRGDRSAAHKQLLELDARFGGLAAPHSVELARRCNCVLGPY